MRVSTFAALVSAVFISLPAAAQTADGDFGSLPRQIEAHVQAALQQAGILEGVRDAVERQSRELQRQIDRQRFRFTGPEFTDTFSKTVRLGRSGTFELSNVAGDITVTGGGGDEVRIQAVKRVRRPNESDARAMLREIAGAPENDVIKTLGAAMDKMAVELDENRRQLADKERLARELEIAVRIQTSILPRDVTVPGLEIAAAMNTATEVGGDYYDVVPVDDGCWIGIGDVSGHGLTSGLIMLMIQSAMAGLGRQAPNAAPRQILSLINALTFSNRSALMSDRI